LVAAEQEDQVFLDLTMVAEEELVDSAQVLVTQ
jgi:hypothetical protein